jgi:hypothetical protein
MLCRPSKSIQLGSDENGQVYRRGISVIRSSCQHPRPVILFENSPRLPGGDPIPGDN